MHLAQGMQTLDDDMLGAGGDGIEEAIKALFKEIDDAVGYV